MIGTATRPRPALPSIRQTAAEAERLIRDARAADLAPRFYHWPAVNADLASGRPIAPHLLAEVPTWEPRQDDPALD